MTLVNFEYLEYKNSIDQNLNKQQADSFQYGLYENLDPNGNLLYTKACWEGWTICDIELIDTDRNEKDWYAVTGDLWVLKYALESGEI